MKFKSLIYYIFIVNLIFLTTCQKNKNDKVFRLKKASTNYTLQDSSYQQLTTRQKIGQTVILWSKTIEEECRQRDLSYEEFFKLYPPGGIFVGTEVIKEGVQGSDILKKRIQKYRKSIPYPVIICADMEDGVGSAVKGYTRFPRLIGIGATQSPKLAYNFAKISAMEAKSLGINWLFAPVSDLIINHHNTIVNTRSISDDPIYASWFLKEIVKGYQDHGIMATAKHFPGDGMDYRNQHFVTSENYLTFDKWQKYHGMVFNNLIHADVASIMTGHISLPDFQQEVTSEFTNYGCLPATLSSHLTSDLLKKQMNFKGVVVSDALIMGGYLKHYSTRKEADLACFMSGTDMLLWPSLDYYDVMEDAISSGKISEERLSDALTRIWSLKEKAELLANNVQSSPYQLTDDHKKYADEIEKDIIQKSLTLVQNEDQFLPLNERSIKNILLLTITEQEKSQTALIKKLKSEFQKRGAQVTVKDRIWFPQLEDCYELYDLIIYAVFDTNVQPAMGGKVKGTIWSALTFGREKSVVISFDNPFYYDMYRAAAVYINAYNKRPVVAQYLVEGIYGQLSFQGRSSVDLNRRLYMKDKE